jgi:hypothetical protein
MQVSDFGQGYYKIWIILVHPFYLYVKGKGKAIPLQALIGAEVSRRLRLPDFKTIDT